MHKTLLTALTMVITLTPAGSWADAPIVHGPVDAKVSVCFVPESPCEGAVIDAINSAKTSIRMQAFQLSLHPIAEALIAAYKRGVDVKVIVDYTEYQTLNKVPNDLLAAGIPMWIDHPANVAHNKLIIIDNARIVGGSFNYTKKAETENAENVLFVDSPELAGWYTSNWESRQAVSQPIP